MNRTRGGLKSEIVESLDGFRNSKLLSNAKILFQTLGYSSEKTIELSPNTPKNFLDTFDPHNIFQKEKALFPKWKSIDIVFQITDEEIHVLSSNQLNLKFSSQNKIDDKIIQSYLFVAVELKNDHFTRTDLSAITREINRLFPMPVLILFKIGESITFSVINRRLHKRDTSKDVLEKVTLIKDIRFSSPHRAHIEILHDLSFEVLFDRYRFSNFVALHDAWQKILDSNELNKRFYRELANWYFWAVHEVTFPSQNDLKEEVRSPINVIRLITRIIFVWFVKEKGLLPESIFNEWEVRKLLKDFSPQSSSYYKAILQNLFFATLNTKIENRKFRDDRRFKGKNKSYMLHNRYRYKDYFTRPDEIITILKNTPFLNGGLFECLDAETEPLTRIDGFSDRVDNELNFPNYLFFSEEQIVDLNEDYGTKNRKYKVRGLVDLLQSYKFTIVENTPIEEEIALDPELLGQVFENLLASYNPETETTARKQTGSFYTPREIVNYMVNESLIAYLKTVLVKNLEKQLTFSLKTPPSQKKIIGRYDAVQAKLSPTSKKISKEKRKQINQDLYHLFEYTEEDHRFSEEEVNVLIDVIDTIKIIDPACGSGAFPMGILHKLVYVLSKLDPENRKWKKKQITKAKEIEVASSREAAIEDIEHAFEKNRLDYARKLYLIKNCIFGVDIQPVAAQIAKLRFFISLIIDQNTDDREKNRGLKPLPNLETKIVAANTIVGFEGEAPLKSSTIIDLEKELKKVRIEYFDANSRQKKRECEEKDKTLREKIGKLLEAQDFSPGVTINLKKWDPYNQNQFSDFFNPEWMFGEKQGFDVVIGNPPYVRQEKIKDLKPILKNQYTCYTGMTDLYVYFYELGFSLLKTDGILTYISSNKYFRSRYGKKLRAFFSTNASILQLIDFGDAKVFTSIAYPSIIVLQKLKPGFSDQFGRRRVQDKQEEKLPDVRAFSWKPGPSISEFADIFASQSFGLPQKELTADVWQIESPDILRLLEKLNESGKPLGEYVNNKIFRGIITGLNKALVVDGITRDRLINEDPACSKVLKPFLHGKNIKRWQVKFDDKYLITFESSANKKHPWSGMAEKEAEELFAKTYPSIYKHFQRYRAGLVKRDDQGHYYWELRSCKYWNDFKQNRIVWGNLAKQPQFSFAKAGFYLNAPAVMMVSDSKYLLGILNSTITQYLVSQSAAGRQGGFLEFKPMYISPIAIPKIPKNDKISTCVDKIINSIKTDSNANIISIEAEMDARVAHLYKLTEEEFSLILNETNTPDPFRVATLNTYRDISRGILK